MSATFDKLQTIVAEQLGVDPEKVTPDAEFVQDLNADSLDLVELNPFLDERGRTAKLMVDLVGSLMGRKVFDRPTRSF